MKLIGTIKPGKSILCDRCKTEIPSFAKVYCRRVRALSYKHARDAGTMYPTQRICESCSIMITPLTNKEQTK